MSGYVPMDSANEADVAADELATLLQSSGWARFCRYVASEWGEGRIVERMRGATGPDAAKHEHVARVLSAVDAVHELMTWPTTEHTRLTRKKPETDPAIRRRA